jgi:hypothetical protein
MIWYTIIGSILGFLGSVIFAAALIKPPQQIKDENATYFNENPFTIRYELEARKSYIIAFLLLITGFAISLGGQLSESMAHKSQAIAILLAVCLSLAGYLGATVLLLFKIQKHEAMRVERMRRAYRNQVEGHRHELRQEQLRKRDFEEVKKQFSQHLKERLDRLPDDDDEIERQHYSDINSSNNWDDMLESCERFLNQTKKLS